MIDTAGGSTSAPAGDVEIPASPAPHIVHLAERCPGNPHPFDTVTLRKHATIQMGIASAFATQAAAGDEGRMQAGLAFEFLRYGIEAWTFPDPVTEPLDRAVIERWLPFENGGLEVVEAASALYGSDVLAPFVRRFSRSSPAGPADHLTSATNGSGRTPRRRSK